MNKELMLETNWDRHYNNPIRKLLIILGLKGNVFLNSEVAKYIFSKSTYHNSFIEIGSGGGLLSKLISKKFNTTTILDKSKEALLLASKRSPTSKSILTDIFKYTTNKKYDAVASLGLVEHFNDEDMQTLIKIHIDMATQNGCVFILVPAHNKERELEVIKPNMIRQYGYQDAFAEIKIENFLNEINIKFEKIYFDKISNHKWYYRIIKKVLLIPYLIFGLNIEKILSITNGNSVLFFINKSDLYNSNP